MANLKGKSVLVYDYGNFFPVAQRLADPNDGFGQTFYYCPYVYNGFPDHRPISIGKNVPNVIRVKEWADVINEVDIVVFPDCYEARLQSFFQQIGKFIFGSKGANELEWNRGMLKEAINSLELPSNPYWVCNGVDELEEMLKEKENVYVKSSLRGDMESWLHQNYLLSRGELQRMRANMGTYRNNEQYIVEQPIEAIAEIGIDTFCSYGQYPTHVLSGIELKDIGYAGKISKYSDLPKQLTLVSDAFAQLFFEMGYSGWHSNEVIIGEDKRGYVIDLTQRCAQPPTDLALTLITNYPDVVWTVARGGLPEIEFSDKWGVQFIIKSETARTEPSPIIVPDEYKKFVRLKNLSIDDDGTWNFVPHGIDINMVEIGSVVATGNTLDEALLKAIKIADSIKGFDIKINTDCIDKAKEQLNRLKAAGINYLQ